MLSLKVGLWQAALGGGASQVTLAQIQALFGGGEQGIIHDLTNPASVFQERTGASATTPSGANGPIGSLKDWSPNNNWAIAPSDAARPLWRAAGYAETDGTDDYLQATFAITQPFVRISCFRPIAGIQVGDHVYGGVANNAGVLAQSSSGVYVIYDGTDGPTAAIANDEDVVITERHSNTTSRIAKNNAAYAAATTGATLPGGLVIGGNIFFAGRTQIRLYRLVEISRDLTDQEVTLCRRWCGAAAGLNLTPP